MEALSNKNLAALLSIISLAIGGASGTLAGDYRSGQKIETLEERLHAVERSNAVIEEKVSNVQKKVDKTSVTVESNTEKLNNIGNNVGILLERTKRRTP